MDLCGTCGGIKGRKTGITYFVQRQGWVKIGSTIDIEMRLKKLQKGGVIIPTGMDVTEPVLLIGCIPDNREHLLHEAFFDSHAAGEWFSPNPSMRQFLTLVSL